MKNIISKLTSDQLSFQNDSISLLKVLEFRISFTISSDSLESSHAPNDFSNLFFLAVRYLPEGFIFDQAGDSLFTSNDDDLFLMF